MVANIFQNFLRDAQVYDRAHAFWQDVWQALLCETGQESLWKTPWLNTTFADGTPCRDGNPIFSAVCPSLSRGIRIIQLERSSTSKEVSSWTDTFADGELDSIQELVVACVASKEAIARVQRKMKKWIVSQVNAKTVTPIKPITTLLDHAAGNGGRVGANAAARKSRPPADDSVGLPRTPSRQLRLEKLEESIDDCVATAKRLDRDGLDSVIRLLRKARNHVVWKLGNKE